MSSETALVREPETPNFSPRLYSLALLVTAACFASTARSQTTNDFRKIFAQAVVTEDADAQLELIKQLVGSSDESVSRGLTAWRLGELYIHTAEDSTKTPFLLDPQQDSDGKAKGIRVADGQFLTDALGKPQLFLSSELTPADTTSKLRKAITGEHQAWLVQRIRQEDFTLRGLVAELAERGLKVDYRTVWNFVHAEKLSFKKNSGRQRAGASRRGAPAGAVDKVSGPDRS